MAMGGGSPTDRMMMRVVYVIFIAGGLYGLYCLRPVYWMIVATSLRKFNHGTMSQEVPQTVSFEDALVAEAEKLRAQTIAMLGDEETKYEIPDIEIKPSDHRLSKELVEANTQDGYITITWANYHYIDFTHNWIHHLKKTGLKGLVVGAMDVHMLQYLVSSNIPTWWMDTGIQKGDLGWGSPDFHKMGRFKIQLIKEFLAYNVSVIISDIDTVWLRNPIPYFDRFPTADVLTSTDELGVKSASDNLLAWPVETGAAFNIGIMMFRPKSKAFVDNWIKALENPKMWDQTAFNELVLLVSGDLICWWYVCNVLGGGPLDPNAFDATNELVLLEAKKSNETGLTENLFRGDKGQLVVGILPPLYFASGHVFFAQTKHKEFGVTPYVGHATFQYSGTPGKRHRMREFLMWDDPPSYFTNPKGYISMSIDIPQSLWDKAKSMSVKGDITPEMLIPHFELVHYQLIQLRSALMIAFLTHRIVIMPPIWCQLDKYWGPLFDGNLPGSEFVKPFICPMDHILDIEAGWNSQLAQDHGPHVGWREYSFLQNPRLPASVNNSRVELEIKSAPTRALMASTTSIVASPGISAATLKGLLAARAPPSSVNILHMSQHTWRTIDPPEQLKFVLRLQAQYDIGQVSVFCCLRHDPGHVWYDFFSDIDHEDRFGRAFKANQFVIYPGEKREVLKQ
eukprot:gene16115-22259_t